MDNIGNMTDRFHRFEEDIDYEELTELHVRTKSGVSYWFTAQSTHIQQFESIIRCYDSVHIIGVDFKQTSSVGILKKVDYLKNKTVIETDCIEHYNYEPLADNYMDKYVCADGRKVHIIDVIGLKIG